MLAKVSLALSLTLWTAAADAADQFDLICTSKIDGGGLKLPSEVFHDRYIVDLDAMEFCINKCPAVLSIKEKSPSKITFRRADTIAEKQTSEDWWEVSRVDGKLDRYDSKLGWRSTGVCEPAAFSGLPKPKF